ncbi:MAG: zf-TFIIB domain-containing protein [Deltaproteobacteria bacterium]|nr:zf-TFIIB domain-containing protein [Deltaproteobacteria bacterium]
MLACRRCGGGFVSAGVGLRLLAVLQPEVPPTRDDLPPTGCPVCRGPMRQVFAATARVGVDACSKHGVWFDAGDLAPVVRAVAQALGKPVPEVADALDAHGRTVQPSPAPATTGPASAPRWTPSSTEPLDRSAQPPPRPDRPTPVYRRTAADTAIDAVDLAIHVVALPFELTFSTLGALASILD